MRKIDEMDAMALSDPLGDARPVLVLTEETVEENHATPLHAEDFHSKDGLVAAILERHGTRVLADITERTRSLGLQNGQPTAREVMECVAIPYFELLSREPRSGREWLRIVTNMARVDDVRVTRAADATTLEVRSLVASCFPAVEEERRAQATSIAVMALLSLVSFLTTPDNDQLRPRLDNPATQDLVLEFVAGGLNAAIADPD